MSKNHDKSEKATIKQKLTLLIQKNSLLLVAVITIITLVVIGLLIYNSIQIKNLEKYTQEIETIQDKYTNLSSSTDETNKKESINKIIEELDSLIDRSPKNYAFQRALYIRGNLYYQNKEWDKAIEDFKSIFSIFPNSYLAPISLINAATAYEDSNKIDDAIETYILLISKYSNISPEIPNIYFSLGRLYEQKDDNKAALVEYNNLVDIFPDSNWTNLARSRIIYLESR